MKNKAFMAVAIACMTLAGAMPSYAQGSGTRQTAATATPNDLTRPQTYGPSSLTSWVIGAYDFTTFNSATTYNGEPSTGARFFTSPGGLLLAPAHIPNGALLTHIESEACDSSATGAVIATLSSSTTAGGVQSEIIHGSVSTGDSATPGCNYFEFALPTPVTVDNFNRTYYVQVTTGTTDITNRFSAVRLYYLLQISPAPGTATFTDVPVGHPLHRFVEALVASGITGGCGGGNYCPDAPLTRGQMAVFLSAALGLHFPF